MYVATGQFDLRYGHVPSLKAKRALVRPLVHQLRRQFEVACGEVGDPDLLRRAVIGVAAVGNEAGSVQRVVARCEEFVAGRPESELLSARVRLFNPAEDFPM